MLYRTQLDLAPQKIVIPKQLSEGLESTNQAGLPPYYWAGFTIIGSPW